ncbi:MAG: zf-TFIIB domain-containing protein [Planctomycetota bacterium]
MEDHTQIECPKCGVAMEIEHLDDGEQRVTIDRCSRCSGLWLDWGEREKLIAIDGGVERVDRGVPSDEASEGKKGLKCPRDGGLLIEMVDLYQPHVVFERCSVCRGTFLDAGELLDLSEVTLREGLRRLFR